MKTLITPLLIILTFLNLTILSKAHEPRTYNHYDVVTLGADPNSNSDSSMALVTAWNKSCDSVGESTIYFPEGNYLVQTPLKFSGKNCKSSAINIVINGTLVAPIDFDVLKNAKTWLLFEHANGVTVFGGVFDGQGAKVWDCKQSGQDDCPLGMTTLGFRNSRNVFINGTTSLNSQLYHIVIDGCQNVNVQGVTVSASGDSPNTDGIHVETSSNVIILSTNIGTGDDCISIGPGTRNLWMEDIACGPGHGISIGSLGKSLHEARVHNVTVLSSTFIETTNGVRIKSWGRPSDGSVDVVLFKNLTMADARNPILIDQHYCPHEKDCPGKISGVKVSNVTYEDIHGTSATKIAVKLDCSSKHYCSGIIMKDIVLTHDNKPAISLCNNCEGSILGEFDPEIDPQSCNCLKSEQ